MKSPLWIVNSILAFLLIIIIGYIFLSSRKVPSSMPLKSSTTHPIEEELKKPLDEGFLKVIYQDNDLFGTYVPTKIIEEKISEVSPPPPPPIGRVSPPLPITTVTFMEPLKVSVTGIIMSTNEADNQVIISDNATKQQKLYKVGDKILDAHILRIFHNKVILIRANGQEETLFVTAAQANAEMKNMHDILWDNVIQKKSDNHYLIDPDAFSSYITSLAQFIDLLDLTTVFSKGISIGTRIGRMPKNSIGFALGLMPGDIIVSVNNISATNTSNRVEIYNAIRKISSGIKKSNQINVDIIRSRIKIQLQYVVESIKNVKATSLTPAATNISIKNITENIHDEKTKLMQEKYKFNNTIADIKKRDKLAMAHRGSKKSILSTIPYTS